MLNPEKFKPQFEKVPEAPKTKEEKEGGLEEDPRKFLESEEMTEPSEDIVKIAESLQGKTEQETLKNILNFLGQEENLKHVDLEKENPKEWRKLFGKRIAEEIFESKTSYGCGDTAVLFLALTRSCGIPAKFIEGKRIGKSGTHSWAQVFIEGKWVDIDPTQGIKGMKFDPEKVKHGPYKIISKSLGPSDSIITSYEDWRKVEKLWDYKKNILRKEK